MRFYARLISVLLLGASAPGIFAEVPVVEASDPALDRPAATTFPASVNTAQTTSSPTSLLYQLELLKVEVQELRGLLEEQTHQLNQMREEQRDRYLDLDRRISLLNKTMPDSAAAVERTSAVPSPTNTLSAADEQSAYHSAFELIRNKRYDEAITAFSKFVDDFPNGNFTANAYYWLGEVQVVKANYQEALTAFGTLLERFPQHRKVPDAKYKLGKVYVELGDKAKAKRLLQEVVSRYQGSSAAKLAEAELRTLSP